MRRSSVPLLLLLALALVASDGTLTQLEVQRGQALWGPAETHAVRNVGPTRIVVVETEVKGEPGS